MVRLILHFTAPGNIYIMYVRGDEDEKSFSVKLGFMQCCEYLPRACHVCAERYG